MPRIPVSLDFKSLVGKEPTHLSYSQDRIYMAFGENDHIWFPGPFVHRLGGREYRGEPGRLMESEFGLQELWNCPVVAVQCNAERTAMAIFFKEKAVLGIELPVGGEPIEFKLAGKKVVF